MKDNEKITLSVVETERKYTIDPTESVYGNGDGIVSWGVDNALPNLLGTCYDKGATLKAAIDQSINYVKGDGVEVTGKWAKEINRRGETMDTLVEHIISDYYIYGNFAVQIIYNGMGIPVELYPLDVTRCRLSGDKTKVYYSKKVWTKYQTKADEYDRWGYSDLDPKDATQIYFYNGTGIRRAYNRCPWFAALNDVLTEIEGSIYSLNSVSNGFSAKYVISLPNTNNLTDEQKKTIEEGIKTKFTGPDAPNQFMLYYNESETQNIEVRKIEADETPERFVAVRNGARENVFVSLRISPLLCGLGNGNTGFATQEFSDSYKLYDRTVAQPIRKLVEDAITKITGLENRVHIIPFTITFDNAQ